MTVAKSHNTVIQIPRIIRQKDSTLPSSGLTWLFQGHRHDPVIFRLGLFPVGAFRRGAIFHAIFLWRRRRFRRGRRRLFLRRGQIAGAAHDRVIGLHQVGRVGAPGDAPAASGAIGRNDAAAGANAILGAGGAGESGTGAACIPTSGAATRRNQRWTLCFCFRFVFIFSKNRTQ